MAAATKASTEVAKAENTGIVLPEGMNLADLQRDAGAGVSDMDAGDVALPYIAILQGLSPQVNPGAPQFIEGAQASMFLNNVSLDVYEGRKEGLIFVNCAYERKLVEWVDRDKGGGWVAEYPVDSDIRQEAKPNDRKQPILPNGNLLIETAYHYGLYKDPETGVWGQCVTTLKSTGLKVNRRWNNELLTTRIPGTEIIAPRWLYAYQLRTVLEQKANNSWWQLSIEKRDIVSKAVYDQAKMFYQLIEAGDVKRSAEPVVGDTAMSGAGGGDGGGAIDQDKDIPF